MKMNQIKPLVFDTGIAFVGAGHTIIVHKFEGAFGIYNRAMTEDEIKETLEPTPFYGLWGDEGAMKRKLFFDLGRELLAREAYLELVNKHGQIK